METEELTRALEPSAMIIPENARIRILTEDGSYFDITEMIYEETTNTVWLKVKDAQ